MVCWVDLRGLSMTPLEEFNVEQLPRVDLWWLRGVVVVQAVGWRMNYGEKMIFGGMNYGARHIIAV